MGSKIIGLGMYAPPKVLTNLDLEKMVDTNDAWITERTGIRARHIAEPRTAEFRPLRRGGPESAR